KNVCPTRALAGENLNYLAAAKAVGLLQEREIPIDTRADHYAFTFAEPAGASRRFSRDPPGRARPRRAGVPQPVRALPAVARASGAFISGGANRGATGPGIAPGGMRSHGQGGQDRGGWAAAQWNRADGFGAHGFGRVARQGTNGAALCE